MNYYLRAELFNSAFFLHKIFLKAFTIFIICICLNNCSKPDKIYEVKGTIHEINLDKNEVIISHDTIQGLMYPMIMPFTLTDINEMNSFKRGDSVHFDFLWAKNGTQAKNFKYIEEGYIPVRDKFFSDQFSIKEIGDTLDNVTLLDLDSNKISLHQYNGDYLFISYIFSRCPMPNLCPAIFMKNKILANEFIDEKKIKFILVSFDYKYDTPSVLKDLYETSMDVNTNLEVLSSTGYIEDIYQLVKQSGGDFWGVERGKIGHKLVSILVGPQKEVLGVWNGDKWEVSKVSNSISMIIN